MTVIHSVLFWLAAINLVVVVVLLVQLVWGGRRLIQLHTLPPDPSPDLPPVSVLVAARNEAKNIEAGLASLLALDYPHLELVVVDDRSTDETGAIVERMAQRQPQLQVIRLTELPAGWLGKNHAQHLAARSASGQYLLFTDADVVMEQSVLRRAVPYARQHGIDHLTATPQAQVPGWLLQGFICLFSVLFSIYVRPWSVRNPRSSAHIGIGAFNLVRGDVYRAVGGHQPIAMRPDDDVKLGKLIKKNGYRQEVLIGNQLLHVPWYESLSQLIRGLEKNTFAVLEYNLLVVLAYNLLMLTFGVWPFIALLLTKGSTWWLNLAICGLQVGTCAVFALTQRFNPFIALAYPLLVLMFIYIQLRAALLTLWNQGIQWRDTHYRLAELKANRV